MHHYFKILASFIFLFAVISIQGQVSFTANANRTTVGKNEEFTVEFKINSRGKNFKVPSFENFRILSGPNTSFSSYMDISGIRQTTSYSFILRPTRKGTYTIGPASIQVNGQTYRTKPLSITITAQSQRSSNPNDPYNRASENVFLKVITNKTTLYQGEPLVASYKIYFRSDIGSPELLEEPDFTGFYKNNIEIKHISTQREGYRGKQYNTGIIRQMILIPQRSGIINPGQVEVKIPVQVSTERGDFFRRIIGRTVNLNFFENFPSLKIKSLPLENQPSDFTGAVGSFKIDVKLNRTELKADESLTLKVRLSGSGNIKLADLPEFEFPNAFEVYDPKYSEKISIGGTGMKGSKTHEYLLIPRYNGDYKIPPISFSYFDPKEEKYKTINSEEFTVGVSGGTSQPSANSKQMMIPDKEKVDFINEDILFIKTNIGKLRNKEEFFYGSSIYYNILMGLGVVFFGMISYFFISYNRQKDAVKTKRQKASKLARKHLKQAKKELNSNRRELFYTALSSALWGYFSDKLNISLSKMTKEIIMETLREKKVSIHLIEKVAETMNRAELARFTYVSDSNLADDYNETTVVITDIEKQL